MSTRIEPDAPPSAAVEARYAVTDGLRLYYRDYAAAQGGRTPVLCLPGLTRNSRDFTALALQLRPARRVITPDLRGRGYSDYDPDWRRYHPRTYVADIWALLDTLSLGRVVVIGTSLGGLMAMLMAGERPEALAGVVLNDVGPEIDPAGLARIAGYVGQLAPVASWAEAVAQARCVYGDGLPDLSEDDWLQFAHRSYRVDGGGAPRLDMDPNLGRALREVGTRLPDPWQLYAGLTAIPTLALRGEFSDILSVRTFERMAARKPDLVRITVPNRGHTPLLDEPVALRAIDSFLATLDDGRT